MLPPTSIAILEMLAEELTQTEISEYLGIDEDSIRIIVETLMYDTNTNTLVALLKESIRREWIT